jgi:hypothetical protein
MRIIHRVYPPGVPIPVENYIKNRKLRKYFNRETCAAIATIGEFLRMYPVDTTVTPLYYATGLIEYEDYGLPRIVEKSLDHGHFSSTRFVEDGISCISPLDQFKVLLNMPLSFISIEFGFKADNAVIYSSISGLMSVATMPEKEVPVIVGAGKTHSDGSSEAGFAFATGDELRAIQIDVPDEEAVNLFGRLAANGEHA